MLALFVPCHALPSWRTPSSPARTRTMANAHTGPLLRHIRTLVAVEQTNRLTDPQLLERFCTLREEAAFAELVRRHGPMVLGVCRRVLRNPHDADDAFQAAFLVLARRGAELTDRPAVGGWLHGVAYRTALKARTAARKRRVKEAA